MGCTSPVGVVSRTTDGLATDNGRTLNCYHGFSVDAGAAAEAQIRDGSVSGTILGSSRLAGAGKDGPFNHGGVAVIGVWIEVVSGTPTVSVYGH